jgi:hypothetical protein
VASLHAVICEFSLGKSSGIELFWSTDVVLSCNELLGVLSFTLVLIMLSYVLLLSCTKLFGELSCTLI